MGSPSGLSGSLLKMRGIQDMDGVLPTNRLRWFSHIERSTGWIARKLEVPSEKRPERQKKMWEEVVRQDRKRLDMPRAALCGTDV
jgi:hypothetical protein